MVQPLQTKRPGDLRMLFFVNIISTPPSCGPFDITHVLPICYAFTGRLGPMREVPAQHHQAVRRRAAFFNEASAFDVTNGQNWAYDEFETFNEMFLNFRHALCDR